MILVFGGAGQGQEAFVRNVLHLSAADCLTCEAWMSRQSNLRQEQASLDAPSKSAILLTGWAAWLESRRLPYKANPAPDDPDWEHDLDHILSDLPAGSVCLVEDIGSGIVPLDPQLRILREDTGRLLQSLARRADRVYRVMAGFGLCLKDNRDVTTAF